MPHARIFDAVVRLSRRDGGTVGIRSIAAFTGLSPRLIADAVHDLVDAGILCRATRQAVRLCPDAGPPDIESMREVVRECQRHGVWDAFRETDGSSRAAPSAPLGPILPGRIAGDRPAFRLAV